MTNKTKQDDKPAQRPALVMFNGKLVTANGVAVVAPIEDKQHGDR